ncbi:TIM barrel protein [Chloroflexi bacterium TSY]|nr:TIM barrel protein [Chloroflexi bacterium TSY]
MLQPIITNIGFNTTTLPDGDLNALDNMLAKYVAVGCDTVELTARRLDVIINGKLNQPRVDQVKAILEKHQLDIAVHAPHAINLMDTPRLERHIAVARASIEFCAAVGATSMVIHAGVVPAATWHDGATALLKSEQETVRQLADFAQSHNVRLAMENLGAGPPRHNCLLRQ